MKGAWPTMRRCPVSALGSLPARRPQRLAACRSCASAREKGRATRAQVAALIGPIAAAVRRVLAPRGRRLIRRSWWAAA
eukprot:12089163-Alexandrium_andersonii.AAC.1